MGVGACDGTEALQFLQQAADLRTPGLGQFPDPYRLPGRQPPQHRVSLGADPARGRVAARRPGARTVAGGCLLYTS
ncbi:hypothetical protein, partial [Streptomyces sp. b94]|uniref:hypothetical protein n=1 Tax=Streptomyces sp. b94 TaxID=1827634 RepID=UPI001C54DBD8